MLEGFAKIEKGDKFYLIHAEKHKFWEICNIGKENRIRYGKWSSGEESKIIEGARKYNDEIASIDRALVLVLDKESKGYILLKKENIEKSRVNNRFSQIIGRGQDRQDEIEIDLGDY